VQIVVWPGDVAVRADLGKRTHAGSFGCLCGHHHGGGGAIGDRAAEAARGGRLSVLCSKVCLFRHCHGRSGPTSAHSWLGAVGIILVSLTDTIATATSFASRRGDEVDPDQEMVGIGTSNIAAGFLPGFAVSVSGSRTAVAMRPRTALCRPMKGCRLHEHRH
jgi:hypothetical protein